MPNIKSAKKRVLTTEKKTVSNNDYKKSMRTAMKKLEKAIKNGEKELIEKLVVENHKRIDNACNKGVIKQNARDRYKAKIAAMTK